MSRTYLPLRPSADGIGLREQHGDETDLQPEPEEFDDDPQNEVALKGHFARHGIFPQRGVERKVAGERFHHSTAPE